MAGILAASASKTMIAGDTAVDNSVSGFVTSEQITLSTTPTGTNYAWTIGKPAGATGRSDLSASTGPSVKFTPDVEGYYTIRCTVDSVTVYNLRVAAARVGTVSTLSILRFLPLANSQVPTPATGRNVYFSSDANAMVEKRPDGTVHVITTV